MSTPNPTHIIAGHHVRWWSKTQGHSYAWCWCGEEFASVEIHAEHVVSKLTDAGYSIVQPIGLEYAPCWQNEHGVHPLNSTTAWRKGAEDDVERLSADDPEIFLGVHYRTPWVAAVAEGEKP